MNGWLFLIARGRRRGYRTLLAPDYLISTGDYGAIEAAVRPTGTAGQIDVAAVTTRAGRRLTMAYTTHVVTAADLAETGMLPRDEHSRPLTLLFGYACEAPWTPNPTQDELRAGREQALDIYRRFLADEDATTVSASHPRQIQTYARQAPPPTPAEPVRSRGVPWNLAIVALTVIVIAVIAVVAVMLGRSGAPDVPEKDDCLTGIVNDGVIIDPQRIDCGDAKALFTVRASLDGKTWDDVKTACEPYKNTWPTFWATDEESGKGTVLCLVLG